MGKAKLKHTPTRKTTKLSPISVVFGGSWDAIVEVPLVKFDILPELIRNEVVKRYPQNIETTKPIFWTVLGTIKRGDSSVLTCLSSVVYQKADEPPDHSVPAIQAIARTLVDSLPKGNGLIIGGAIVVGSNSHQVLVCSENGASLQILSDQKLIQRLASEPLPLPTYLVLTPEAAPEMLNKVVEISPAIKVIASEQLQQESFGGIGYWPANAPSKKSRFLIPILLCLVLALAVVFKNFQSQDALLRSQKAEIIRLQQNLGNYQTIKTQIATLEKEFNNLDLPMTVGIYKILAMVSTAFAMDDRAISVRYDGANRSLAMTCVSRDPIRFLKNLNQLELFENVTSSNMVPVAEKSQFLRFQWNGVFKK